MPPDPQTSPEPQRIGATYRTKQLLLLAAESTLEAIRSASVDDLVADATLPGCYRSCYEAGFRDRFHNMAEQTRNTLVSDLPFVANTLGELAAHAIFREAHRMLDDDRAADAAAAFDAPLGREFLDAAQEIGDELDDYRALVLEESDVLALFEVPADSDPARHLQGRAAGDGLTLLRFENWLVPFGGAPRPQIAKDGRAVPAEA